jgi:hypothetical protein
MPDIFGNAGAIVANAHLHPVSILVCADGDGALFPPILFYGLANRLRGVDQHVKNHLVEAPGRTGTDGSFGSNSVTTSATYRHSFLATIMVLSMARLRLISTGLSMASSAWVGKFLHRPDNICHAPNPLQGIINRRPNFLLP